VESGVAESPRVDVLSVHVVLDEENDATAGVGSLEVRHLQ
jgi:hypothetical protein